MSLIEELSLGTSVNLGGYRTGFAQASRMVDDFAAGAFRKLEAFRVPAPSLAGMLPKLTAFKAPALDFAPATRGLDGLGRAGDRAVGTFKELATQAAVTVGAFRAVSGAVGFLSRGTDEAAHLEATIGKTNAVLGEASPAVKRFADDLSSKFGLVKGEVLEASSSLGGIGKALGNLSGKELESFTTRFTKLAADFQEYSDLGSLGEASKALTVALSGNQSDLLKEIGVITTEAAQKQYALANGIQKVGGAFSEQQKFAIISGIILERMGERGANAIGALERESDGATAKSRRLSGVMSNLSTTIGAAFLPAKVRGMEILSDGIVAATEAFTRARPSIDAFSAGIGHGFTVAQALATRLGPSFLAIGRTIGDGLGSAFGTLLGKGPDLTSFVGVVEVGLATLNGALQSTIGFVRGIPDWIDSAFGPGSASAVAGFAGQVGMVGALVPVAAAGIGLATSAAGALVGVLGSAPVVIGAVGAGLVALTGTSLDLGNAFSNVGFAARNFGSLGEVAFLRVGAWANNFLENLSRLGSYFATNWLEIMLAPLHTLNFTLEAMQDAVIGFLRDPSKGIQFDLSKAFKAQIDLAAKLPDLVGPEFTDVSAAVDEIYGRIAKKEAAFERTALPAFQAPSFALPAPPAMAAAPKSFVPEPAATPESKKGPKFAGAFQLGSREAYDAILKGVSGGPGNEVLKVGRDQLGELRKLNANMGKVAGGLDKLKITPVGANGGGLAVAKF